MEQMSKMSRKVAEMTRIMTNLRENRTKLFNKIIIYT